MTENLDGLVLDGNGPAFEYVSYVLVNEPHGNFKEKTIIDPNRYHSEINPDFNEVIFMLNLLKIFNYWQCRQSSLYC